MKNSKINEKISSFKNSSSTKNSTFFDRIIHLHPNIKFNTLLIILVYVKTNCKNTWTKHRDSGKAILCTMMKI